MKSTKTITKSGTIRYHNYKSQLHREDGPAVEWTNGNKFWYFNGQWHRLDGPAIECTDGYKSWWIEGKKYTETGWQDHPLVFKEKLRKLLAAID